MCTGPQSSTYFKQKVGAEAAKDRLSLSKSPLPEEMPPAAHSRGHPCGCHQRNIRAKEKAGKRGGGEGFPANQRERRPKSARVEITLATMPSPYQKATTSGRGRAGRESNSLASQKCMIN